jgi:tripartite-type tricarboxylate transporter receptor subunit TctC
MRCKDLWRALGALAVAAAVGIAAVGPAAAQSPLTVVLGYERASLSAKAFSLIDVDLSLALGAPVVTEFLVGDSGARARARVAAAGPEERVVLAMDDFETTAASLGAPALKPLAKLSRGISLALVVPEKSDIHDWPDFVKALAARPLRVAANGPGSVTGIGAALAARVAGGRIDPVTSQSTLASFALVADAQVDAAVVTTFDLPLINALTNRAVTPIVTYGAKRAPGLSLTPTLSEVAGNAELAFTTSVSVYASPQMTQGLARQLTAAIIRAGQAKEAAAAARAANFPLQVEGPDVVVATTSRDVKVVRRLRDMLEGR